MRKQIGLYDPHFEHDACGVGFVANVNGRAEHDIIVDGITVLKNLEHRGAMGGDGKTGDGAGMLVQIPHRFFRRCVQFTLPDDGKYGVGFFFLPSAIDNRRETIQLIEDTVCDEKGTLHGWREVPVDHSCLGELALSRMPAFLQMFVSFDDHGGEELERKLYVLRKCIEKCAASRGFDLDEFYVNSLSSRTITYKGMFVASHFEEFYPDLAEEDFVSSIALVHARYSTNTLPSWFLAQPFRFMAHNGEINTLRRNINNMTARETSLVSDLFGQELEKLFPIANPDTSDSAIFDNVFELLIHGGRSLEHALIMMVPEAFGIKYHISEDKRAFFEYHAAIMEPWDGPAAIAFSDGIKVGATLDRNGLRPGRYVISKSGKVVLASEVGVLDIPPEDVLEKGRLAPGKMFVVDTRQKRVLKDNEIKSSISRRKPYRHWLEKNKIELKGLLGVPGPVQVDSSRLPTIQRTFGYTMEDLKNIIVPMIENSQEPVGSMGNDASLAVLSRKPQLLYNYFKQQFAQVTNPPIDPYRENLVMSLMSFVGRERNLLGETPEHCHQLKLAHPILTNDDIERLRSTRINGYPVCTVPILFDPTAGPGSLQQAINIVCEEAERRIDEGNSMVILSDRNVGTNAAAIPALLATSAVHHYLVGKGKRHLSGLVVETGEAREVHHFATLVSFGASGINPYLAFESMVDLQKRRYLSQELTHEEMLEHYITAIKKGLLKIMSKMGISTIRSYRGSQIFEAVGLNGDLVDRYFTNTPSRIGGIGIDTVERDTAQRHRDAFQPREGRLSVLDSGGVLHYRTGSEQHLFSPEAITLLQKATTTGNYGVFKQYTGIINDLNRNLCTLRGLFKIKQGKGVAIDEVEPVDAIIQRFVTSGMSFGSISKEAHESIAIAMNRLGSKSNSGEGGEDEVRFSPRSDGENANSRIKQVASGRFGVTSAYLASAGELQIKMAQGAKPGEGGQLPGHKVNEIIAKVRSSTPGVMLISPPPHHDIYSIEDLAQLIFDLKNANPEARVSVKLVSEVGVGTIAAGVAKGKSDTVLISGHDGGTGASPISSILYAGTPWEIGLAETQQVLVMNNLRDRIRVQVDGQIKTARDVIIGALLGAEEFGFATTALVTMGCIMMRKCHLNTCPVGVATQDPELRKRFRGKPEYLVNFMTFLAQEVRELMADLGFRKFEDMVGRVDLVEVNEAVDYYKSKGLDFARVLYRPEVPTGGSLRCTKQQVLNLATSIEPELIEKSRPALDRQEHVRFDLKVRNFNRTIGSTLSYEVSKRYGVAGLPDDTISVDMMGSAGQSFAAFLAPGITFRLEGDANDYFGKGLSGGKIIVYPPKKAKFRSERNIITGNVNLFGATSGEVFINGMAGERFCVRNSGAYTVVEGVGDHGCEYMTGGRVIVLGDTGVNFAAGMSGGIAYVLDRNQLFDTRCNLEMVDIELVVEEADIYFLKSYIRKHFELTGSKNAAQILDSWEETLPLFVKVMPMDYRLALEKLKEKESREAETVEMTEEVYT
ncbi:MAG: glutamate synthase large subunit [Spirochaetales bacterium]|nr:glutamate synthase large subunit [Spirochaetales bacterium]